MCSWDSSTGKPERYLIQEMLPLARELKEALVDKVDHREKLTVFLCGGSTPDHVRLRRDLGTGLSNLISKYRYTVHYPEDMFVELILGHQKKDLLNLENLLAESVHCVVILLQSPGTMAELGAFVNHAQLRDKLIVIVDPHYRASRGFINLGPLRLLRTLGRGRVLHLALSTGNLKELIKHLAASIREVSKVGGFRSELTNPIAAYDFYLALVSTFDPVELETIMGISCELVPSQKETVATVANTVVNSLISERKVAQLTPAGLSITSKGVEALFREGRTKRSARLLSTTLTKLRLRAMNLTLRGSMKRILITRTGGGSS